MLTIIIAYLAGVITLLSPCVLPVLPLILSGTSGNKNRSYGIIFGFTSAFTALTLFLSTLVRILGISADFIRTSAILFIAFFALTILIPPLQLFWERITSKFLPKQSSKTNNGFIGGLIFGLNLAILWTPCVGPILASVISLALTGTVTLQTFFITLSYSLGTASTMLLIMAFGRNLTSRLRNPILLQKGLALLMLATAIAMYFGFDRQLQTKLLDLVPTVKILDNLEKNVTTVGVDPRVYPDSNAYPSAPDFTGGGTWLNSPNPLSLKTNLKGKVVLVDFWTYTCINCIRTLPYVQSWQEKYAAKGFTVVGVHSPEFEIEKNTKNVEDAITRHKLTYPVVQDNDFKIWSSYDNRYWPAHYLIDKEGRVRYTHFGEGNYLETENKIRELLDESPITGSEPKVDNKPISPETYLGTARADYSSFRLSPDFIKKPEYIESASDSASLQLRWLGSKIILVLSSDTPKKLTINSDGAVTTMLVDSDKEYILADTTYGQHQLELTFQTGIRAYAFTFGQ